MKGTVQKWGNSLAIRLPKAYAEDAGLRENSPVEILMEGETIVIAPPSSRRARSQRIPLSEYLDRITPDNLHGESDAGEPQGHEVL